MIRYFIFDLSSLLVDYNFSISLYPRSHEIPFFRFQLHVTGYRRTPTDAIVHGPAYLFDKLSSRWSRPIE